MRPPRPPGGDGLRLNCDPWPPWLIPLLVLLFGMGIAGAAVALA